MAYYKKGSYIGKLDSAGREICAGDQLADAKGRHYTVNNKGQSITDGGSPMDIDGLVEVVILDHTRPTPPPEVPETPTTFTNSTAPAVKVKGRASKSGWIRIENLAPVRQKELTYRAAARALEQNGIEVVNRTIESSKREAALAILNPLAKGRPMKKTATMIAVNEDGEIIAAKNDAEAVRLTKEMAGDASDGPMIHKGNCDSFRSIKFHDSDVIELVERRGLVPAVLKSMPIDELKGELERRGVIAFSTSTITKDLAKTLLTDEELAGELRRRGFELTAVKRIVL